MIPNLLTIFGAVGDKCTPSGGGFLGFPKWYTYLPGVKDAEGICSPQIHALSDIWLVAAAVIEILLRVASILAVIMVIYGAFSYITSEGVPEKTNSAKSTIVNSLVGLAIAVMSAFIVTFIAGKIS